MLNWTLSKVKYNFQFSTKSFDLVTYEYNSHYLTPQEWVNLAYTLDHNETDGPEIPFIIHANTGLFGISKSFGTNSLDLYRLCALTALFTTKCTELNTSIVIERGKGLIELLKLKDSITIQMELCTVKYTKFVPTHWAHTDDCKYYLLALFNMLYYNESALDTPIDNILKNISLLQCVLKLINNIQTKPTDIATW